MLRYSDAQLCHRELEIPDISSSMPGKLAGLQAHLDRNPAAVLLEICGNLLHFHKTFQF